MPSCSYKATDVALFDELSDAVSGGLSALEAQHLAMALEDALRAGVSSPMFEALTNRWLNLIPLMFVTGKNQDQQRRVLIMLKTIFEAVASSRRSGVRPAVVPAVEEMVPSARSSRK